MATTPKAVLTLIAPEDEAFDSSTGRKGKPDVVGPLMADLVTQARDAELETFQIPDQAEFEDSTGKVHKLNVNKVRTWAKKVNSDDELDYNIGVGGGNGRNISVTFKPTESK